MVDAPGLGPDASNGVPVRVRLRALGSVKLWGGAVWFIYSLVSFGKEKKGFCEERER